MSDTVVLDGVKLIPNGSQATVRIPAGSLTLIAGPAASGKSRLLRCISGAERPHKGQIKLKGKLATGGPHGFWRRATPNAIARRAAGQGPSDLVVQAMVATNLYDFRRTPLSELSASQIAAMEVLPALASDAQILVFDLQLDRLDPWVFDRVMERLRWRMSSGATVVAATHRPEFLSQADIAILMRAQQIAFAGNQDALRSLGPPTTLEIETTDAPAVRAAIEPLVLKVEVLENGLRIETDLEQAVVAQLLREGFGNLKTIVTRRPTMAELLRNVIA